MGYFLIGVVFILCFLLIVALHKEKRRLYQESLLDDEGCYTNNGGGIDEHND